MNMYLIYLICLLTGYLAGSILFAHLITKLIKGKDIRDIGNKNPGAQNIYLYLNKYWGVLTGLLDALKAFIPILIADHFFNLSTFSLGLIGIGAMIGHVYPLFFNFKGGRGGATIMGIYLFFIPYELLVSFIITPLLVFILFKKDRGVWIPFGLLIISASISMFFNHSTDVKIIICATVFLGLSYNLSNLPLKVRMMLRKKL